MIQINTRGILTPEQPSSIGVLRQEFQQQHYIRVPGFLAPEVLALVQPQVSSAHFVNRVHQGIGPNQELCMSPNTGLAVLMLLLNDKKLFQFVQHVTGCAEIRCFEGRVYRVTQAIGQDAWHDDLSEGRLAAISINLTDDAYGGGRLQIRDRQSKKILAEIANRGAGHALIFRLSNRLEHRITSIEGPGVKTALAGWFRGTGSLLSFLRVPTN